MYTHTHTHTHTLSLSLSLTETSDMFQMVKSLSKMLETQVRSLGQEDPLEKEMATHSSTLTWKIPWTEEPGRLQFMGSQRVGHDWVTWLDFLLYEQNYDLLFLLCH